jgi:Rod binding domain-containing protein
MHTPVGISGLSGIGTAAQRAPAPSRLEADQASFRQVLSIADRTIDANVGERSVVAPNDEQRKAAQDFVALAFVQPILKQLRESNQAAAPFAPSSGQRSFQQMLDGVLSRKITQASSWELVDKVHERLAGRTSPSQGGTGPVPLPDQPIVPVAGAQGFAASATR